LQIYVNGESKQLTDNSSLAEIVSQLGLPAARIAIELNRMVIRRVNWEKTVVREGDRLEIVHFVGGGDEIQQVGSRIELRLTARKV
jgi:thiamine biosynthesis protein ThiS